MLIASRKVSCDLRYYGTVRGSLFLCSVTHISATVAPIGVKFCVMVHMCPRCVFSLFGGCIPKQPEWGQKKQIFGNFGLSESHLTANMSKTAGHSVTCKLELNTNSMRAF